MNAVERSLMILHTAGNIHAKTLTDYIEQIKNLHEEAQDNVKFLSTIRKPTQVLVDSMDFKVDTPILFISDGTHNTF